MSDDDDESFNCPVCGEDLTELDSMWRQVHITSCLSKQGKPSERPCQVEECPVCGENLSRMSASLAQKHINKCLDRKQQTIAQKRETERCPFCGMNIKNLNSRQRKIHQQTCQETNKAQTADVVLYPKVVETLPTPEEWEIIEQRGPVLAQQKLPIEEQEKAPLIGKVYMTSDLQCLDKHHYFNNDEIMDDDLLDPARQFKSKKNTLIDI